MNWYLNAILISYFQKKKKILLTFINYKVTNWVIKYLKKKKIKIKDFFSNILQIEQTIIHLYTNKTNRNL